MVGKRRRQLKKKLFILLWISLRFFEFREIKSHTRFRDIPRRDVSKQRVVGNALNINPSCLKVRLKTNSKGWGDMRLSLKVEKKIGVSYTIIGRVFWNGKEC